MTELCHRPSELQMMKLGVHADWKPVPVPPRFRLSSALATPLLNAYGRIMSTPRILGMNDKYGDCVPTGCCQRVQTEIGRSGNFQPIPNSIPPQIYSAVTGFNPAEPSTDQGTDPNAMFEWWQKNEIYGFKCGDVTVIDPADVEARETALEEDGAICACVALSMEMQNQVDWAPAGTAGSWGYHFICLDQFDGLMGFTAWGLSKWIQPDFFTTPGFVMQLYRVPLIAV